MALVTYEGHDPCVSAEYRLPACPNHGNDLPFPMIRVDVRGAVYRDLPRDIYQVHIFGCLLHLRKSNRAALATSAKEAAVGTHWGYRCQHRTTAVLGGAGMQLHGP